MNVPPLHPHEVERLVSVCGLHILNTGRSPIFDLAARQAAALCGAPIGLVTLLREADQAFLGATGIDGEGTSRDSSFCAYTILQTEAMVVEDARQDRRFAQHPAVLGAPFVRFYAGVPFFDASGLPLGSVCVVDNEPRTLSTQRLLILHRLASLVGVVLEARRVLVDFLGIEDADFPRAIHRLEGSLSPLFESANGLRILPG